MASLLKIKRRKMSSNQEEHEAVTNFREYLRIPTVHPNVDYSKCVEFLLRQAQSLNLPSNIYYMAPGQPIVVITWLGQKPELPSILLNSHTDVVPVYPVSIMKLIIALNALILKK
uniref:Aminoacylase-1 n=1 Tax=Sipha flava TaxID=143950 RepID=A0A2S2PW66_9HEMI